MLASQPESLIDTSSPISACRHCGSKVFKKWGYSDGLQRYRCKDPHCRRTFNALTNTVLTGLQHRDKWQGYLVCMMDSLPLRKAAKRVGIDLTTAFRWRHRFLKMAAQTQANSVSGVVEADETFFLESHKGKRQIPDRNPRKREGEGGKHEKEQRVPVLIVRDRHGEVCDFVLPSFDKQAIHERMKPVVSPDSILCSDGASWYQSFAKAEQIAHHRLITLDKKRVIGKEFHIQNVNGYISRLKRWMARFNGVGTDYLANYLGWRRMFETTNVDQMNWFRMALEP